MRARHRTAVWSALVFCFAVLSIAQGQEKDGFWDRYGKARAAKAKGDAKGYAAGLRSALELAPEGSPSHPGTLYQLAQADAMKGDPAAALADLTRLFEEKEEPGLLFYADTDPVFAATRALPGYRALLARTDEIQVTAKPVHGNVWAVEGAGCTLAASVGPDGILLVDTGYAPLVPKVRAALAKAAPGARVRFVVNSHVHEDHTAGNASFSGSPDAATVIAHPKVRLELAAPHEFLDQTLRARPNAGLPAVTVDEPVSLHLNGEEVRLLPLLAHTDGDLVVIFTRAGVVHMGDDYAPNDGEPYLFPGDDPAGYLRDLTALEKELPEKGFVMSGHAPPVPLDDLKKRIRTTRKALELVRSVITAGLPSDEVLRRAAEAGLPSPAWIRVFDEKMRAVKEPH
jgi:glyoxylase-like metal-dependent hydrolase (beta-lactamase superfamily II)